MPGRKYNAPSPVSPAKPGDKMKDEQKESRRADGPHWLARLSGHHARLRRQHAQDRLLFLVDVDAILAESVGTERALTDRRSADPSRPPGISEIVRWFRIQPGTFVAPYSGESDGRRRGTLAPRFRERGYRVFACIARDSQTLHEVARSDPEREILLVHVGDPTQRHEQPLPDGAIEGGDYELAELIGEAALPERIAYCWHGLNDEENVRQFLASRVTWGECDVQADQTGNEIILRHDTFRERPAAPDEHWLTLETFLARLHAAGRSVKIDLKEGGGTVARVLRLIAQADLPDERLWFNASVERIGESGFRALAAAHPQAVRQVDVNFLAPLMVVAPEKAQEIVELFQAWGVNRFSFSWLNPQFSLLFDRFEEWGRDINVYNVPDLESFLRAVLLQPRSLTSDFNFPRWGRYGRGSGENGVHHEYPERTPDLSA
jgi:hypothetical protein